jgi:hypothetical protein
MAIDANILRNLAQYSYTQKTYRNLHEAKASLTRTAFLCHSHKDEDLVRGLVVYFGQIGWNVYVDWMDASLPDSPTRETAQKIQSRIRGTDFFLFLATRNSTASRWCPWEIGYADGIQKGDKVLIIPVTEGGVFYGNEYLQLYRRIDVASQGGLGVWGPQDTTGSIGIFLQNIR